MPPQNTSFHAGPCGGGTEETLSCPRVQPGDAACGSQPGGIIAAHIYTKNIHGSGTAVPHDQVQIQAYAINLSGAFIPRNISVLPDLNVNNTSAFVTIFIFSTLVLFSVFALLKKWRAVTRTTHTTYHQLFKEIKEILHPSSTSVAVLLEERAEANQRLARALHLSNTFVSSDLNIHKTFVGQASHLLKTTQRIGWAQFQGIAIDAVRWQLSQSNHNTLKFDSFVQNITLVVVLVGLLQVDKPVASFSHEDVTLVANRITTLWALSKKSDPIPPALLEELTTHLRRLVVNEVQFPSPLNFVIPAWETLWRVVATTIAYSYNDKEIRKAFGEFHTHPSESTFEAAKEAGVSIKSVVNEVMRLHPPSKHIGRSKRRTWWPRVLDKWTQAGFLSVTRRTDVEKLLRCCDIWGPDANEFRPSRHTPCLILPKQKQALMVGFGYGPLRCIAASWAPVAAGVIAGAILDEIDMIGYVLHAGAVIGGREGWIDWLVIGN